MARAQGLPDEEHLRVLAILHFVLAGLCLAGIGLLVWHYTRMHNAFLDLAAWKKQKGGGAALEQFLDEFRRFHVVCGAVLAAAGGANWLSGLLICRRRGRTPSMVIACLNCLIVPAGTVLGAFTMVVLLRDSVRQAYGAAAARRASAAARAGP